MGARSARDLRRCVAFVAVIGLHGCVVRESPSTSAAPAANSSGAPAQATLDPTIIAGQGLRALRLGDDGERIRAVLGPPDAVEPRPGGEEKLDYHSSRSIDFLMGGPTPRVIEIYFDRGWSGHTLDGITIGDPLDKVLAAHGGALSTLDATPEETHGVKKGGNRVLYRQVGPREPAYKFVDSPRGILYWFDAEKRVIQIVATVPRAVAAPTASPPAGSSMPPPAADNPQLAGDIDAAKRAATQWLTLVDRGHYAESWDSASTDFKKAVSRDEWAKKVSLARLPLGTVRERKLQSIKATSTLPGAPDGRYVVITFATEFAKHAQGAETVTPKLDVDGRFHVTGYYIR